MSRLCLEVRNGLGRMKSGGQRKLELMVRICILVQAWSMGYIWLGRRIEFGVRGAYTLEAGGTGPVEAYSLVGAQARVPD